MYIQIIRYLFLLYCLFFIICAILAPISAGYGWFNLSANLTSMITNACHQQPDRSIWIMGYPMALCSRCLGVYMGCFVTALFNFNITLKVWIMLILLAIIDIILNYVLSIDTGNFSRFIAGICFGISLITLIKFIFMKGKR